MQVRRTKAVTGDPAAIAVKAKLFRGLADPTRLEVLEVLRDGKRNVSEVVDATGFGQPTVSMHLACLWECGIVERERSGRFVYYWIADTRVLALLRAGDDLLVRVGDRVLICARYQEVPPPGEATMLDREKDMA